MGKKVCCYFRFPTAEAMGEFSKAVPHKRVAVYVHRARADDWGMIKTQVKMLENYVCKNGGTVVDKFAEVGYVGKAKCRPKLTELLKNCEKGKYDEVVILRQSHLSRNFLEFMAIYNLLKKYGVGLNIMENGGDITHIDIIAQMRKEIYCGT